MMIAAESPFQKIVWVHLFPLWVVPIPPEHPKRIYNLRKDHHRNLTCLHRQDSADFICMCSWQNKLDPRLAGNVQNANWQTGRLSAIAIISFITQFWIALSNRVWAVLESYGEILFSHRFIAAVLYDGAYSIKNTRNTVASLLYRKLKINKTFGQLFHNSYF